LQDARLWGMREATDAGGDTMQPSRRQSTTPLCSSPHRRTIQTQYCRGLDSAIVDSLQFRVS